MMIRIHKEGFNIIATAFILLAGAAVLSIILLIDKTWALIPVLIIMLLFILFILNFFRVPVRKTSFIEELIYSPADGRIVAIEEVFEDQFLKEKRIQVSVFMSVWDVHINYYPFKGTVTDCSYHPGKFLVARHPKSSSLNERTSIVIENDNHVRVLIRQIAGIVARRIVCYSTPGESFNPGDELGFIKFGSRVDLFLPVDSKILVNLNDKVLGGHTPLASF